MISNPFSTIAAFLIFLTCSVCQSFNYEVHDMKPGRIHRISDQGAQILNIYCYKGVPKHVFHIWQTVYLSINLTSSEYELYQGESIEEVVSLYENQKSSWTSQIFTWRSKNIQLAPFNNSCVGLITSQKYEIVVNIIRIDFWRMIQAFSGLVLFLWASRLSSNPLFYYICGVTLGITSSFLILVYFISKLIPQKPVVYGFLMGGWTIGVYLFQLLWQNARTIVFAYQNHLLAYLISTGFLSFVFCYRFGPVTDPRSKNLIKWSLQISSLAAIFFSSHYQEASASLLLILIGYYNFPHAWTSSLLATWKRKFPPKTKLLTEDEYHEQGARETIKALDELREYCSSPECNQWKTVLRLKHPIRFAEFVEGKSHLTDDEILEYESDSRKSINLLTDDSSENSLDD